MAMAVIVNWGADIVADGVPGCAVAVSVAAWPAVAIGVAVQSGAEVALSCGLIRGRGPNGRGVGDHKGIIVAVGLGVGVLVGLGVDVGVRVAVGRGVKVGGGGKVGVAVGKGGKVGVAVLAGSDVGVSDGTDDGAVVFVAIGVADPGGVVGVEVSVGSLVGCVHAWDGGDPVGVAVAGSGVVPFRLPCPPVQGRSTVGEIACPDALTATSTEQLKSMGKPPSLSLAPRQATPSALRAHISWNTYVTGEPVFGGVRVSVRR